MVYHRSTDRGARSRPKPANAFANDGSFMEMFKKLQEQQAGQPAGSSASDGNQNLNDDSSSLTNPKEGTSGTDTKDSLSSSDSKVASGSKPFCKPLVGKRRGGRFLATGKVKKLKAEGQEEDVTPPKDAWSLYLAEVKKYKQSTCEEEGKTRPLVK